MTILVTGAPGNVATPLLQELLAQGADLRAAVYTATDRLPPGVPQVEFDFTDPRTWPAAFDGVTTMFLLRPPQLADVDRDIAPAMTAARDAGVRHVVFLSIQGAQHNPVVPHHAIEKWLRRSGMSWTFVRAAYFMQNLTTTHGPELAGGEIFVPAGRARTALVDARDVAAVAAVALLDPAAHSARAYTVTGPQALTYQQCATILTQEWQRPIRYTKPGLLRYCRTLYARGVPRTLIVVTVGLYTAARLGLAAGITEDVAAVTGRAPRDFGTFARDTRLETGAPMTAAVTRTPPPLILVRLGNPIMRTALRSPLHGILDGSLLLLHLTGRRTGRHYDIPVGHHDIEGQLTLFTNSAWRANLRGGANVEITYQGRRQPMRAELNEDPTSVALIYQDIIERLGWRNAQRRLGIRIHVQRTPTPAELEEAVRDSGLSTVQLTPR